MNVLHGQHPTPQDLAAFALGKLDDAATDSVFAHLEACPECRRQAESIDGDSFVVRLQDARSSHSSLPARSSTTLPSALAKGQPAPERTNLPAPPQVPAELANHPRYRIVRELGRGGMGVVYQAEHTHMGRPVAIKVIARSLLEHPGALERFQREVKAAAKLNHPNIVLAHDAEQVGDLHMLVMEFVEGHSLAQVIQRKGVLPIAHACHYVRQAALGLQHAFEQGMVHRDVKPQNLMVTTKGKVKILDFGLAKVASERGQGKDLTASNAYMGTPDYCAPEQASDARTADIRADVYSLGCTLYCLLAGRPPFQEGTAVKTIMAHMAKTPQPLPELRPEVPTELWAVVARMLAKEPDQRYQKPLDVAEALAPFCKFRQEAAGAAQPTVPTPREAQQKGVAPSPFEDLTTEDLPPKGPKAPAAPASKRNRWGLAIAALILVVLGLGAWVLSGVIFKVKTPQGIVLVEIDHPDAELFVDGQKWTVKIPGDKEPIQITLPEGTHDLKVVKGGFEAVTRKITIKTGQSEKVRIELRPAAPQPSGGEGNPFFNGKDLTGWDGLPGYWRVENGAVVGAPPPGRPAHTFLISKRTYRDFELKFQVRRKDGVGNSGVQIRSQIKDPQRFTLTGPQVEIDSADFSYPPGSLVTEPYAEPSIRAPGAQVAAQYQDADFNEFFIRCVGKHIFIKVNGVITADRDFPTMPEEGFIAWQLHGKKSPLEITFRNIEFKDLSQAGRSEGFVPLFNGKDLTGWKVFPNGTGNWKVEDGLLVGSGPRSHLFTERGDYQNFHFRVEAMINDQGNSGQYFRAQLGPGFPLGWEAQINSTHSDPIKTGSLYPDLRLKLTPKERQEMVVLEQLHKPNEWFTQEVIANGNHILIKVNGKTTVDFVDEKNNYSKGHLALQQHHPGTVVKFRKIEVKELPAP